jgi:hypothetical protein
MQKKSLIIIVTGGSNSLFAKKNANPFDKVVFIGSTYNLGPATPSHQSVQSTHHRNAES